MANPEHLAILGRGVKAWNEWRSENRIVIADLSKANLSKADLSEAYLRDANLNTANLRKANLRKANLFGADLSGANLSETNLGAADLIKANLHAASLDGAYLAWANLRESDLSGAKLRETNLSGASLILTDLNLADLSGAQFNETVFAGTNLQRTLGLETCRHDGPSALDYRTLRKSGPLPLSFLRGCGLPEQVITYLPSLLNEAIQFYSCFISYSTKEQEFADRLYTDLQNKGVRCWFAPHDMQSGKRIHEQIDEAIRRYDRLLLILSDASMSSQWVQTEIAKAREREVRERRRMLFPIRLVGFEALQEWECFDADTGKDSAREIREYFVPDFSRWKDYDAYREAFDHLLRDLKAEQSASNNA
jgi:hypothetical protein